MTAHDRLVLISILRMLEMAVNETCDEVQSHLQKAYMELLDFADAMEPDTSDIPEATEAWFKKARLVLPK